MAAAAAAASASIDAACAPLLLACCCGVACLLLRCAAPCSIEGYLVVDPPYAEHVLVGHPGKEEARLLVGVYHGADSVKGVGLRVVRYAGQHQAEALAFGVDNVQSQQLHATAPAQQQQQPGAALSGVWPASPSTPPPAGRHACTTGAGQAGCSTSGQGRVWGRPDSRLGDRHVPLAVLQCTPTACCTISLIFLLAGSLHCQTATSLPT